MNSASACLHSDSNDLGIRPCLVIVPGSHTGIHWSLFFQHEIMLASYILKPTLLLFHLLPQKRAAGGEVCTGLAY